MVRVESTAWLRVIVAAGLLLPSVSAAQVAKGKTAAGGVEIEEITVTAQKREESLQEIPVSVTAFSSEVLKEKGVVNVVTLGESVPNLRVSPQTTTQSGTVVSMRGTGQGNPNPVFQQAVGLYVDGVYIAQQQGSNIDVEDLERVEVLRGPQGTLFGRNTIGGAVNFVSKKPTEDRSVYASTQVGNFDTFNQRLTLNVPVIGKNGFMQSDAIGTLSIRQNVAYKHRDGYFDNSSPTSVRASGSSNFDNLNRIFSMTGLRWQPTKNVTVDYSGEYHRYRDNPRVGQVTYIYPGSPVSGRVASLDLRPYQQRNRVDSTGNNAVCVNGQPECNHRLKDDGNHRMHILTGTWDVGEVGPLGKVTVKSISAYRSFTHQSDTDIDGSPLHLADFASTLNVQHWSEELQWVGAAPRVNYIIGGYYYGEYSDLDQSQTFFGNPSMYQATVKTKSYAPFGQITYTPPILGDRISITGGVRYTAEQVHTDRGAQAPRSPTNPNLNWHAGVGTAFNGSDGLSPMGNISVQATDNLMAYFRVARGFKGGGFNGSTTDKRVFLTNVFGPEKLLQYELGFKSQWFDNRLRLNADGFYSDYKDLQASVFRASPELGSLSLIENAGAAEIWGTEVEATAVPLRGVEVTAGYSFTSPKYTEFLDQQFGTDGKPIFNPDGSPKLRDVASQMSFPFTPEHQAMLGVTYTAPATASGVFSAHMDAYWQDKTLFTPNAAPPGAQAVKAANYALINGRLQFADIPLSKGSLDLAVFGRNLADKKYRDFGIDFSSSLGWAVDTYGPPRTFGLELAYHFTAGEAVPPPPAPVAQAPPPPPPAKKKIVLRSVHFDFDKATLKADAKPILDEAVQVLKQEGSVDIVVEGHTDSVGTDRYNLGLSRRRAETVRSYLVDHGVAKSRITAEGMGESKPVASNDTADGRAQNRRVELHVR